MGFAAYLHEFLVFAGRHDFWGTTVSTTLMTVPAEGWYPDPADAGHWRWWDGAIWTDHVQVKATEPITAPQAVTPAPEPVAPHVPEPAVAPQYIAEPTAPYAEWLAQAEPPAPPAPPAPTAPPVAVPVPPTPVPVEPVPAASPAPFAPAANSVPQPGSLVAAPSGLVSMTPTTPISDQMYWHSSAAEVIEVPRLHNPATSSIGPGARSGGAMPRYLVDWNDIGSPHTAGVWVLAFTPILLPAIAFAGAAAIAGAHLTDPTTIIGALIALTVLMYVVLWTAAGLDVRALRERGYRPPKIWWMLLFPPIAYLIARGKAVRRESRRAWPPELVYVITYLLPIAAYYLGSAWLATSGLLPSVG
jgi:uncharacterized membrane protein YhaH (DUF805 family)